MSISLDDMSALARALVNAEKEVEALEERLSTAKDAARQLREETIPSAMQELGMTSFTLDTGQKLTIKQDVYASLASGNKLRAFAWLEENGHAGLIRTEVIADYGKGELEKAKALYQSLSSAGVVTKLDQTVHPQTLKAFLREQLSAGVNVPLDIFGARPVWTTKVK